MSQRICEAEGCDRPKRRYGLCGMHSQRFKKYGATELPPRDLRICEGPGCDRTIDPIYNTSGLCRSHYKQRHLGKSLTPLKVATKDLGRPAVCSIPGCERPHKARGFCKTHDAHLQAGRAPGPISERRPPGMCEVEGCEERRHCRGMCTRHYASRYERWVCCGLTPEQGRALYQQQGGCCAICRLAMELDDLRIDHDHSCCPSIRHACGECVRGLLCQGCNFGIGHMGDDPGRLRRAAAYLARN